MNRGGFNSTPPVRGFYTPNNRHPNPNTNQQQNNTVNIPFYRDTHNYNRNFGGGQSSGSSGSPYFNQRRGGGGGFHDNRRFNNGNNYTPRITRPHFQRGSNGIVDISQFYHPSMLEDPWKDLIDDSCSASDLSARQSSPAKNNNDDVDEHKNQLMI